MNIMPILSILKSDFLQYIVFFHSGPAALREKKLCIVKNLISKWTIQTHYIIVQLKYAVENLQHNFNSIVNLNHVEYSNISIR